MVKFVFLLVSIFFISTILPSDKQLPDTNTFKSFFSKKYYSASIRDSIRITSSTLSNGPAGSVSIVLSDPTCTLVNQGDYYIFYSSKTGIYRVYFSSRSSGSLMSDTITIAITDKMPELVIGKPSVITDINQLFSLDLDIKDDADSILVLLDIGCDNTIDTMVHCDNNPYFRYGRPTRTGEKENKFPCKITVIDNDSHKVSDTARLIVRYRPPSARIGNNIISCADEPVLFSAKRSRDENGTIKKYLWDFNGDNKTDTVNNEPEVEKTFSKTGDRNIILRVMDNDNNISAPDSMVLSIFKDIPSVSIIAVHEVKKGDEISLIGTGKVNCGEIEKYLWDFYGNGQWGFSSRSHGRTSHIYREPGSYQARFMVVDNKGDSAFQIWQVKVIP